MTDQIQKNEKGLVKECKRRRRIHFRECRIMMRVRLKEYKSIKDGLIE